MVVVVVVVLVLVVVAAVVVLLLLEAFCFLLFLASVWRVGVFHLWLWRDECRRP